MTPTQLNSFLYAELPLASALQLQVLKTERNSVSLSAPYTPNRNAHGSAFGGSLAALGILGGWAMVYSRLNLDGLAAALVIKSSECDYALPITTDIRIEAAIEEADWQQFVAHFASHRSARVKVQSRLSGADGVAAAMHTGTYVALRPA